MKGNISELVDFEELLATAWSQNVAYEACFFFRCGYSWVSRDVTSFAQVSVRHVGVLRMSNLC